MQLASVSAGKVNHGETRGRQLLVEPLPGLDIAGVDLLLHIAARLQFRSSANAANTAPSPKAKAPPRTGPDSSLEVS